MRLTLRTLLAYMEDALPAVAARRIGRKIGASDAAKRIVRRIRKVMRRRRLTAPAVDADGSSTDPNLIAEYLDNCLEDPAEVARVERRCMRHDVNLAEVAGCHQILSRVLGNSIEVDQDVRTRMYAKLDIQAAGPTGILPVGAGEATPAITSAQGSGRRLWNPAWNYPSFVAVLVAALAVVLWQALFETRPTSMLVVQDDPPVPTDRKVKEAAFRPAGKVIEKTTAAMEKVPAPDAKNEVLKIDDKGPTNVAAKENSAVKDSVAAKEKAGPLASRSNNPPPPPASAVKKTTSENLSTKAMEPATGVQKPPAGMVALGVEGVYSSIRGILVRLTDAGPERLQTGATVQVGDVLVNLDASRSELKTPAGDVLTMVDSTKIVMQAGDGKLEQPSGWGVERGRIHLRSVQAGARWILVVSGVQAVVEFPQPATDATVEFLPAVPWGDAPQPAALYIGSTSKPIFVQMSGRKVELRANQVVDAAGKRGLGTPHDRDAPTWAEKSGWSTAESAAADKLYGQGGVPFGKEGVILALRDRAADRNRDVRKLAVRGAAGVEAYSILVDAIGDPKFADNRSTAVDSLRTTLRCDPTGADAFRTALLRTHPQKQANMLLAMTMGYSKDRKNDRTLLTLLLEQLDAEALASRELAIINLREIFAKDFGFNAADSPSRRAASLRSWKQHLGERE